MNAAIAQHLNVTESAIIEIQEWHSVLWVRVKGLGARFVSKKVVKQMSKDELMEEMMNEYLSSCEEQDAWIDRVDSMIGHLGNCLPIGCNPTESVLRRVAAEVVDGNLSESDAINRLSSRILIKR